MSGFEGPLPNLRQTKASFVIPNCYLDIFYVRAGLIKVFPYFISET